MGLIFQTKDVFDFLREFFGVLPVAVKLLVYGAFGGTVFLCVVKGFRG